MTELDLLVKSGLKGGHFLFGFIAGIVGLMFSQKPDSWRGRLRLFFIFIAGTVTTGVLTPLVLLKWQWLLSAEYSVAFVVGLFGMGLIEAGFRLITKLKQNPLSVLKSLKDIFKK